MPETISNTRVRAVQIFSGKDGYLDAGKAVLKPDCHLAVVQGLLTADEVTEFTQTSEDAQLNVFNELVPQAGELDAYIGESWWPENGCVGYDVFEHRLVFSGIVKGNSEPHTDMFEWPELGPLTSSLGLVGCSTFFAEKPSNPFVDDDRYHNEKALLAWNETEFQLPSHSVEQNVGDLAIFSNYPWVSNHAAYSKTPGTESRQAAIFNYRLIRTNR